MCGGVGKEGVNLGFALGWGGLYWYVVLFGVGELIILIGTKVDYGNESTFIVLWNMD